MPNPAGIGGGVVEIKDGFLRVVTLFFHPCQEAPMRKHPRSQMPLLQSSETPSIPTSKLCPRLAKDDTIPVAATAAEQTPAVTLG